MLTQWRFGKFAALLVALILLGVTLVLWQDKAQENAHTRDKMFAQTADQVTTELRQRLTHYEFVLRGVKGFIEGSDYISRDEYSAYFEAIRLDKMLPGLQAVSVSEWVAQADVASRCGKPCGRETA